ncbi:MAG: efflux RND transporter periplasmic adaptor subunit [Cyanobacteria bacterium SZAS TMP-1]|nr:efflux RND transporter periplasmic adaptor subunit [Cyanobacteria bacterium SZAS TMP-1]
MKKEINSNVGPRVNAGGLLAFFLSISFSLVLSGCEHQSAADNAPEVGKTKVESDETKIDKVNGQSIIIVAPETEKALNLKVAKVQMRTVDFAVKTTGEVQANANLTTHVNTPVSGRVTEIFVRVGDVVKQGQHLMQMHSQDIEQAEADLLQNASQVRADLKRDLLQIDADITQGQAQLGLSQSTYMRVKGLLDEKIASRADYEAAKTQYDKDKISLDALHTKRQATVALSSERMTMLTEPVKQKLRLLGTSDKQIEEVIRTGVINPVVPIVSPETGIVTERFVNVGELADPTKPMFTIADFTSVWLKADVYEKDISKVKCGQPIELDVDSFPGEKFSGRLNYVADSVNQDTRTLMVRAEVPNPGNKLKPKMFARMRIFVGNTHVLTIDKNAVQDADDDKVVYVPMGGGRYREQKVKLGGESGNLDEVLSGVKNGEPVVVNGSFELRSESLKQSN